MPNALSPMRPPDRRLDLDWVRIGAFGLLILFHVGMFYVPWDWHVKSSRPQAWLEPVMMLTHPWRLSLLFLVSGAATRFMADKLSPARLARLRIARLLPPLAFAMLVIVPPQSWLQVREHGYQLSYLTFWGRYLRADHSFCQDGACLILPTWNHMWFVAYLLVYTLLLTLALALARPAIERLQRLAEGALRGSGLFVWPILYFAIARIALAQAFPETHALVGDWYVHAISAGPFLLGFLIAKSRRIADDLARARWPLAIAALVTYAAWASFACTYRGAAAPPAVLANLMRWIYGADQWTAIAAVLGFARAHLALRDGPARRYLTEAIFPFYIVHQTIIVVAAHALDPLQLPIALEALLVIAATVGGCFATFEIARRTPLLRPLFGLKGEARRPRPAPAPGLVAGLGPRLYSEDTV